MCSDKATVTDVPPSAFSRLGSGPTLPAADDSLAEELAGYQVLLDAWAQALEDGSPPRCALEVLARHVDARRPRDLRRMLSPGEWFEPWLDLPLCEAAVMPGHGFMPAWMGGGITFWRALVAARRHIDAFVCPYQQLGTRTLARLLELREPAESVPAVYAAWWRCQQALEADIVRSPAWSGALAAVADANAALRRSHQDLLSTWLGLADNTGLYRALSDELASLRRRLRGTDTPT